MTAFAPDRCDHCRAEKPDMVGLSLLETPGLEAEDFGFCSLGCLIAFVQDRYIVDCEIVDPEPARAAAAPSPVVGPPSTAGGGTGSAREPVGSGKSSVAPGRSNPEVRS